MAKKPNKKRKRPDWRQVVFLVISILIVLSMALAFLPAPGS